MPTPRAAEDEEAAPDDVQLDIDRTANANVGESKLLLEYNSIDMPIADEANEVTINNKNVVPKRGVGVMRISEEADDKQDE